LICYIGLEQQEELTDIELIEETRLEYNAELEHFRMQNKRLQEQLAELEAAAERLKDLEGSLRVIEKQAGGNADDLFQQVQNNREILESNEEARKNARMQNLMSFIIRFDDDQDLLIDPEEEDELREKINYAYNLNISFEAFHAFMEKNGRSINSVVLVASKLLNEGLSSNEVVEEHFYGNDRTTS